MLDHARFRVTSFIPQKAPLSTRQFAASRRPVVDKHNLLRRCGLGLKTQPKLSKLSHERNTGGPPPSSNPSLD